MKTISSSPSITSGRHDSCWIDTSKVLVYESLKEPLKTDVVVVGAGIAGLSVAYCLVKAGKTVVVLEDGNIGSGETGRTTAHLVNALDDRYSEIEKIFGKEKSHLAAQSHTTAINFIEETVLRENIDCDFRRVDGYLFAHPTDEFQSLKDELDATQRAGIPTEILSTVPGFSKQEGPCLHFPNQAQFHPLRYLEGLCKAITSEGGHIYTATHVSKVEEDGVIANGFHVDADHIVIATNSPVNDIVTMHTKQFAYRTYVIAATIPKGSVTPALWWDTGDNNTKWITWPYHYVRTQPYNDTHDLLIVGGEDHKTGQAEDDITAEERYNALEGWAKDRFPMMERIAYKWSGQVMEPLDGMAFIGRNPGDENIYIVTGDSGNGMTHGAIAGMLVSDLILGIPNAWEALYDPSRITLSVANDYIREVGNMAAQYLDYVSPGDIQSLHELPLEGGAIIRSGRRRFAIYKTADARILSFSAVCTHLGCSVRWNDDEKSFDCPCHGSRFTCEGKVVNGPALTDLKPVQLNIEAYALPKGKG